MTAQSLTSPFQFHAREIVLPMALGIGLGSAAFIPDLLEESAAPYATPFFSSGFAWGFIALLAGYAARRQKSSIAAGATAFTIAVIIYYGLILVVSQRWYIDPSSTEDGLPTSRGLLSVGRSIGFWTFSAIIGGGVLGWLGWAARHAATRLGSAVIGITLGLLTGEGLFTLIYVKSIWLGPLDAFDLSRLVPSLVQILFSAMAIALMVSFRKQPVVWWVAILVGITSILVNILVWYAVLKIRIIIY